MNFKSTLILIFFLTVSFLTFAQVEDGASRSLTNNKFYDFGLVKILSEYKISIKNSGKYDLLVGEILVPKGVGVTVLKHRIKPGETGIIIVSIDPKYMDKGSFQKHVIVTTYTQNDSGTRISFTKSYNIKGEML